MDGKVQTQRWIESLTGNFGGTIEWAADLLAFREFAGNPDRRDLLERPKECVVGAGYDSIEDLADSVGALMRRDGVRDVMARAVDEDETHCLPCYILEVLRDMLTKALDRYQELIDDGYDDTFKSYAEAVRIQAPQAMEDFMLMKDIDEDWDDYFDCERPYSLYCCDWCDEHPEVCPTKFQKDNCKPDEDLQVCRLHDTRDTRWSEDAPADCPGKSHLEQGDGSFQRLGNYTFKLRDDDKEDFYTIMMNSTGLDEDAITDGRITYSHRAVSAGVGVGNCQELESDKYQWCERQRLIDVPVLIPSWGVDPEDVFNPKDLIEDALDANKRLPDQISGIIAQIQIGQVIDNWQDFIDATSLTVFMAQDAVEAMENAYELGKEFEEAEKENMIFLIVQTALFIIPFIGKAVGSLAGAAWLGRMAALAGETGMAAVDIYKMVDDPSNLALDLFGLLYGNRGLPSDWLSVAKAANARRGITQTQLKTFSSVIAARSDRVEKMNKIVVESCTRP